MGSSTSSQIDQRHSLGLMRTLIMTWFLLARLMGVKVVLASVGAGPIPHPLSRLFFKYAARAAASPPELDIAGNSAADTAMPNKLTGSV